MKAKKIKPSNVWRQYGAKTGYRIRSKSRLLDMRLQSANYQGLASIAASTHSPKKRGQKNAPLQQLQGRERERLCRNFDITQRPLPIGRLLSR